MDVYRIEYYPPDGHSPPVEEYPELHGATYSTIRGARRAIHETTGNYGHWDPPGYHEGVEGWHESDAVGCGGYVIVPSDVETRAPVIVLAARDSELDRVAVLDPVATLADAIEAVEAEGYTVLRTDEGGCCETTEGESGPEHIVTVQTEASPE